MKLIRILSFVAGTAICAAVTSARAQVPVNVNLSLVVLTQGGSHDNNTTTTVRPPTTSIFTTKSLLTRLSNDLYGGTNFPAGARLEFTGTTLAVADGRGNILVPDTSSVLTLQLGTNVYSGTVQDAGTNAAPFSLTAHDYVTLKFAEGGTGGMSFTVSGLGVITDSATKPAARTGRFHETFSAHVNLSGYGTDSTGAAIVLSGTLTGTGATTEGTE